MDALAFLLTFEVRMEVYECDASKESDAYG